ncbi:hypothetical protein ACFFMN_06060 [Planobispora siamensis]|nr:hypothetical protein [Planobispora siamensis]
MSSWSGGTTIAEAHGGTATAASTPGRGSTSTVRLPGGGPSPAHDR